MKGEKSREKGEKRNVRKKRERNERLAGEQEKRREKKNGKLMEKWGEDRKKGSNREEN